MTNLLRLVRVVLALPGRAVIWWLNSISHPQLTRPLRASVHVLVWVLALMAFSMATVSTPTAAPVASTPTTVRPKPPQEPTERQVREAVEDYLATTTSSTPPPTPVDEPAYVPLPDSEDDGDDRESRFCRGRWWC